jgi:hypothetical protein
MRPRPTWLLVVILSVLCITTMLSSRALAQPSPPAPPPAAPPAAAPQAQPPQPPPDFPKFEEVMKDFAVVPTSEPPLFTLWYNKKTDSLRAQLPAGLIGKRFLIATSMAGGPVATGFQLDHFLAYFERMDKKLVLMRIDPRYADGGNAPVADVIKRSYGGDLILKTVNILTMKENDPVIDLDAMFKTDFAEIGDFSGGKINPALGKWAKYRAFPQNVELTADLAVMTGESGRRILVHYSLSAIPESANGYQPRVADNRIGYFLTVRKDWSKSHEDPTLFLRYINRWRLEKRDPTAELSAPKDPIIWYIEKTVPLKFRRWIKEGLLDWNKAFEKCGFLDAVQVVQQEDYDPRTKDLDPEDVRYNFFRWIVTGNAFAMGPSRANPLTGQIFDADIVCDDSFLRAFVTDYERLTGGEKSWEPYNPFLEDFYKSNPQWVFRSGWEELMPNVKLQNDPDERFRQRLLRRMTEQGHPLCECAAGMAAQLEFANLVMEAGGRGRNNEEFLGQMLKELVSHEAGHCLGLRHNFKGSTWLPMQEIEENNRAGEATVGSVMDYNPSIIAPRGEKQGSYATRSIGPYDYWAIEYGYRAPGKPYKDEADMLKSIASRSGEAGLDYGTDEDTMSFLSPDPYSNRYDMGRDVIEFAKAQTELTDSLLKDILTWAVKDGQSYAKLRRAFVHILSQRASATDYVARFCGGQVFNRDQKGDPNERPQIQVVPAAKQREALRFVCKNVFAEDAYKIDPKLLSHLAPGRYSHWDSDDYNFRVEFNVHDLVGGMQSRCLTTLMNPFTIGRIQDNQMKFGEDEDVYTLAEHINTITDTVWSELDNADRKGTDRKPYINSFRRNLQRRLTDILMGMVLSDAGRTVPADANAISRQCVTRLSEKIGKVLKKGDVDATSEAHLADVKKRIDKALEAEYSVGARSGGSSIIFRQAEGESTAPVSVLPQR